jgi:nicotinamide-nucleotide amidase
MAEGALAASGADWAVSVTGIAGPGGGTEEKPVGTVFMALAGRGGERETEKHLFPFERETFKRITCRYALDLLRRALARKG